MAEGGKLLSEYERRSAVLQCLRAGRSTVEISKFCGISLRTVQKIASDYRDAEETGAGSYTAERKRHERVRTVVTKELIEAVQERILEDPSLAMRALALEFNVDRETMRRLVHTDLRYNSYTIKVKQHLSEANKVKRVQRCGLLLNSLKHEAAGRLRFFSDEKIFTIEAKINRQNDRWLARDPADVPIMGRSKFPASVHVLSVVSSEGDVMQPHFFQKGETVTKEVYLRVLQTVVKPWVDNVSKGRPYVFQQDGAPAHTSNLVQEWLLKNLDMFWSKNIWPPNSPDLNPLDYFVWGVIERETNKSRHANTDSLTAAIKTSFNKLSPQMLACACERFRSRIEKVINVGGSYIE